MPDEGIMEQLGAPDAAGPPCDLDPRRSISLTLTGGDAVGAVAADPGGAVAVLRVGRALPPLRSRATSSSWASSSLSLVVTTRGYGYIRISQGWEARIEVLQLHHMTLVRKRRRR